MVERIADASPNTYLQAMAEAVPALISFFDAGHVCRFANDHHVLWYGRSPEQLIGRHMRDFLGDTAYGERMPFLDRVAAGEQVAFEAMVPYRDGRWRRATIRYVPKMGPDGFEGFHALVFDLSRSIHRFRSVFEGTAVGFMEIDLSYMRALFAEVGAGGEDPISKAAIDPDFVRRILNITPVLDLNDKACRMFGVDHGTAIGLPLGRWIPEGGVQAWQRNISAYGSTAESYETETVMMRGDGAQIDVLLSCAFPERREEQVIVIVGFVDISERVAKERELASVQAETAHAARVATLGELMASITHEVNQPLGAVVANGNAALRWLNRAEPDIEEAKAAISRMIGEGARASEIIARTRKLAVKSDGERHAFNPNTMIEESVDITRRQVAALGARIALSLSRKIPPLTADRVQLQQVLINLIINAAQAMTQQPEDTRLIFIESSRVGNQIRIEVADTGPGIPEDKIQQIFQAFFTTKKDGMGMGLSIAKTIVEAHRGTIEAQRPASGGTVFLVSLPT